MRDFYSPHPQVVKGFYSPIDRLMEQSTRPRGTGAEYMAELSKKPGYKPQEAEDRDLQALMTLPKMERAAFMEKLKAKPALMPHFNDASGTDDMRGLTREEREAGSDDQTYHGDYTLPGGTNYREFLLQHPKGTFPGVEAHFGGAPNVLASIRAKDRVGPNGEKILHLEEIQSDWHQQGREKGYHPKGVDMDKTLDAAKNKHSTLQRQLQDAKANATAVEQRKAAAANPEEQAMHDRMLQGYNRSIMDLMPQVMRADEELRKTQQLASKGVPDAPFKKDWHELALKKMIHHAAEKGYDQIAITPGAEQNRRYGLEKQIKKLHYNADIKRLRAFNHSGREVVSKDMTPDALPQFVGKELAEKLLQQPQEFGVHTLEDQDVKVGGEGMKGFYDRMVPAFLNKFGKKHGVQVQPGSVSIISTPAQHHGLTESAFQAQSPDEQQRMVRQHAYVHQGAKTEAPVHTFNITPQMREDVVKNGIPLYKDGGSVEVKPTVKDDAIQRKVPEMEAAAKALQAGAITRKDYDKVVQQHKPVKPYTFVPKPASDEDADRALMENKKPQWRGHEQWPAGRKVGLRLDIPAYEHHGVWVNSVHDEEGSGKDKYPTAYHSVSSVKNATFDASPEKAVRVATGEQNKSPFARIKGELHHMTEDEAVEHMKAHLDHPDYAQVGMDPRRHGFFYDRKTLKPVTSSAHVVQIGPLVLAHKPTYGKRETYAKGGVVKEKVTLSPNMDVMQYELLTKKAK